MATKEMYMSISPISYRVNKSNVLLAQVKSLEILKRISKLKILEKQKYSLKKELHNLFSSIVNAIEELEKGFPEVESAPKNIKKRKKEGSKVKKIIEEKDEIQDELLTIRAKLKELNS